MHECGDVRAGSLRAGELQPLRERVLVLHGGRLGGPRELALDLLRALPRGALHATELALRP